MRILVNLKLLVLLAILVSAATVSGLAAKPAVAADGNIAKLVARVLEQSHYSHHPLNDEIAGKFLDRYLEALDGQHLDFLQSDLDEFAPYRQSLDELIKAGNTGPARQIYDRYLHRLEQRVVLITGLLKSENFSFEGQDTYTVDRQDQSRPKDLSQARQFWRQRLRYEYLQEKLNNRKPEEIVNSLIKRYTSL